MDPQRDAKCGDKNPAQVVGAKFGVSEWTVYRHYKRAIGEGLFLSADARAAGRKTARPPSPELPPAQQARRARQQAPGEAAPGGGGGPPGPGARGGAVQVHHLAGEHLDGFSLVCQYDPRERAYKCWCSLPGIQSAEDLEVRCHSDGQMLLLMNPQRPGAGAPAELTAAQVARLARDYQLLEDDLTQPFRVKKVVRLPSLVDPASASALVTPRGQFFISVRVAEPAPPPVPYFGV